MAGARLFQRTFGFQDGGSAIFRTGGSETRGAGALARRSAGFGLGGASLRGCGVALANIGAACRCGCGCGCGRGCGFGFGNATIADFLRGASTGSGCGSGSTFFGFREAARVLVK